MSNVSTRHPFAPFVAGTSKPLTGQRMLKIGFKTTEAMKKRGESALPSVYASVPQIDPAALEIHWQNLLPYVGTWLEGVQDSLARSLYEHSKGQRTEISDEELSIPACIAFLEGEASGGRLSAELIGSAYDEDLADSMTVIIADKLGFDLSTPAQEETVAKHVRLHRDVLCMLAGKNVVLSPKQEAGIRNMLRLAPSDSPIWARLEMKFAALTAKVAEIEMVDIG